MLKEREKYLPLLPICYDVTVPNLDQIKLKRIPANTFLIRPFKPTGQRASGLWVARNDRHPTYLGHVVGLPEGSKYTELHGLSLGEQVMYDRFSDEEVGRIQLTEPLFDGEDAPVCILGFDSIRAVFRPELFTLRR